MVEKAEIPVKFVVTHSTLNHFTYFCIIITDICHCLQKNTKRLHNKCTWCISLLSCSSPIMSSLHLARRAKYLQKSIFKQHRQTSLDKRMHVHFRCFIDVFDSILSGFATFFRIFLLVFCRFCVHSLFDYKYTFLFHFVHLADTKFD